MDKAIAKGLGDRLYEKRKTTALELEQQIRQHIKTENFPAIQGIIDQLSREFAYAVHQPNARNGGLIGLASTAIGIGGKHLPLFLESIIHPVLACFGDQDGRVRYYACESLYNVTKVAMGEILPYFNEVFDVLCKLSGDSEPSVKNAMDLLDRLVKDIVCEMGATYVSVISKNPAMDYQKATQSVFKDENGVTFQVMKIQEGNAFSIQRFIPLLMERMHSIDPFTRVFLISWISLLNSVPDLELVSYLPAFLGSLIEFLNDSHNDVKTLTKTALDVFLHEIQRISHIQKKAGEQRKLTQPIKELERNFHSDNIQDKPTDTSSASQSVDEPKNATSASSSEPIQPNSTDTGVRSLEESSQFNTVIHKPEELTYELQQREQIEHNGEVYIPGQDTYIDYPKIIEILLSHIDDSEERIQLVVLTWLSALLEISSTSFIAYLPKLLSVLLLTMAKDSTRLSLKEKSQKLNQELLEFVSELESEEEKKLSYKATINTLTLHFLNESEITKVTALEWLKMLHKKSRSAILEHDDIFITLLKALSDPSEEVIYRDLQLISEISFESDDETFQSFIVNLLDLFKNDQKLLEKRGNFILRRLCLSLDPVRVYQTLAKVLKKETNSVFVGIIIQILNNNLITAPELSTLRKRLRSLEKKENFELFSIIFKAWCHNAPATLALCLLSQCYELAYSVLQIFVDFEVTVNVLVQIDILVQLLESPVFTRVRLQLLEPEKYPYLYKCLYGILMLLPQSTAFITLKNRLSSVSVLNTFSTTTTNGDSPSSLPQTSSSPQLSKTNSSKSIATDSSPSPSELLARRNFKYAELLACFRTVQQDHEDSLLTNSHSILSRKVIPKYQDTPRHEKSNPLAKQSLNVSGTAIINYEDTEEGTSSSTTYKTALNNHISSNGNSFGNNVSNFANNGLNFVRGSSVSSREQLGGLVRKVSGRGFGLKNFSSSNSIDK